MIFFYFIHFTIVCNYENYAKITYFAHWNCDYFCLLITPPYISLFYRWLLKTYILHKSILNWLEIKDFYWTQFISTLNSKFYSPCSSSPNKEFTLDFCPTCRWWEHSVHNFIVLLCICATFLFCCISLFSLFLCIL